MPIRACRRPVNYLASPPNTRSNHIQVHDGLLLAINGPNIWALQQYTAERDYFGKPLTESFSRREPNFTAGMRVYDLRDPAAPREIGFMPMEGMGLHRIWWVGGRYAYASGHLEGFIDHILVVIDMADPTKPELGWPLVASRHAHAPAARRRAGRRASVGRCITC